MPDRKVSYILEVDYEGNAVLSRAREDLRAVGEEGRATASGVAETSSGLSKLVGVAAGAVTISAVANVLQQVAGAATAAYAALGEGAALVKINDDFAALAENIGTTAQALEEDLGAALGGLVSRQEMIGSASQLMSLGLAKSHEEAVALATVAGQLNWNMDVLGLTINNQSLMRLDALGLSVDAVEPKVERLMEAGYRADEAFKWALIEAGEEKLAIVGSAAETTAGKLQIMEATMTNVGDAFKVGLATGAAEGIASSVESLRAGSPDLEDTASQVGQAAGEALGTAFSVAAGAAMSSQTSDLEATALALGATTEQIWAAYESAREKGAQRGWSAVEVQREQQRQLNELIEEAMSDLALYDRSVEQINYQWQLQRGAVEEAAAEIEQVDRSMAAYGYTAYTAALAAEAMSDLDLAGLSAQAQVAANAMQAWGQYTDELTRTGAANFTTYAQQVDAAAENVKTLDEIMYEAAQGHGAGIGFLSEFGVDRGIISEEAAAVGEAMAQQIQIAESLAGAVERGVLAWQDYPAAVEAALSALESRQTVAELGLPDLSEYGYSSYGAALGQQYGLDPITLEFEIDDEAVATAVGEAIGIVEGFTSPEEAYEAVVTLNIDDVITQSGEVKTLIDNIPAQKDIVLNVSAVGMELIQELQAAGVLP